MEDTQDTIEEVGDSIGTEFSRILHKGASATASFANMNTYDCDLFDKEHLKLKVDNLLNHHNALMRGYSEDEYDAIQVTDEIYNLGQEIKIYAKSIIEISREINKPDNKILFEEELRMMEDKTFGWDILGFVKNAYYVKKQLYSYHVHPNVGTAVVDGVNNGFPLANFELVKNHIQNGLSHIHI